MPTPDFFNSQYGLFTPYNYMMMQSALQQMNGYSPLAFTGMGGMPGVANSYSASPSQETTEKSIVETKKAQKKEVQAQLEEAFALRSQLEDVVDVNTSQGSQRISKSSYNEKTGYIAEDGKDDGKISWGKKLFNFGKGCLNLVTDMFLDENGLPSLKKTVTTLAVGGVLAAAAFLIPGAGAVLAGAALAGGVLTLGKGCVKANTAKTDEEAEKAWQSIGSGTLQTGLSLVGMKKVGASSAQKLGVDAPKWYRADQSLKLALKSAKADVNAVGGLSNAVRQNYSNMKIGLDKFASKKIGYSHYEKKYTNNLDKLRADIPGTDAKYRKYADKIAAAYEKVYNAKNEAEYAQAVRNLERYSKLAKVYRNSNTGLSDEAAAAFDDMIKISESIAPRGAYRTKFAKFGSSDYTQKMADLDTQINELRALGATASPEQQFKLRILTRTKAANRTLYNANTAVKQKTAVERFDQIAQETLAKMQEMRNNPNTTPDIMRAYNDIVVMAQENAMKANLIVEYRALDLTKAANVLKNRLASDAEKAKARNLIGQYTTNTPADDEAYISMVDDIIKTLKFEKKSEPLMQRFFNWKISVGQKGKNAANKGWNHFNKPAVYVTTTIDRMVYPQSVNAIYGTIIPDSEIDALKKANDDKIRQLQEVYKTFA